jgi:hypothetical protein
LWWGEGCKFDLYGVAKVSVAVKFNFSEAKEKQGREFLGLRCALVSSWIDMSTCNVQGQVLRFARIWLGMCVHGYKWSWWGVKYGSVSYGVRLFLKENYLNINGRDVARVHRYASAGGNKCG